ncbi:MAG: YciI family protein [Candidatus Calditenuis sp.]|nr:YciI family protein [Candidatus Calditenuis sp.]
MPRFHVLLIPKAPPEVTAQHRPAHLEYVKGLIRSGRIVIAGRFKDGSGGFYVLEAKDLSEALSIVEKDPYKIADVREFVVREIEEVTA